MISASPAARSASSSSWRSSVRGSRSPGRGSASSRLSPSRGGLAREARRHRARAGRRRDAAPSASAPACRRSGGRCGSWPGSVVPRVGGRAALAARQASARLTAAGARPSATISAEDRVELPPLPGLAVGAAVSVSAAEASAAAQPATVCGRSVREARRRAGRRTR